MTRSRRIFAVLLSLLLLGLINLSLNVQADNTRQTTLTIVKYGLSPGATGFDSSDSKNDGTPINNLPTDNHGNEVMPVAGIHYIIQEITPTVPDSQLAATNPPTSSYRIVRQLADLITDSSGVTSISLPNGYYLISEQANATVGLKNQAAPLLVKLPYATLDNVYIYPKSSIDPNENNKQPKPKPEPKPIVQTPNRNLPATGDQAAGLMTAVGILLLFLLLLLLLKHKHSKNKVED